MKEVKVGDFTEVLDGAFGVHGIKKGDIIYIAGDVYVRELDEEGNPVQYVMYDERVQ